MPLSITLAAGATTYALQATSVRITLQRNPLQAGLPGVDPLLVDLGQKKPLIVVEGTIRSVADPTTDGSNTIASKRQLEDFAEDLYASTITLAILLETLTDNYVCKIQSLTFSIRGEWAGLWEFSLQLVALSRS